MSETNSFSYHGGYGHEVYEVYEDPTNSFLDQYDNYSYPQSTSSGGYFYDRPNDSYSYETSYYDDYSYETTYYDNYSYETTYYDYYPIYCLYPNYMIYYPEIQVHDYSPVYIYYPYYIYNPVYSYYYVGNDDYTLPAPEYYGSSSIDQSDLYESDVPSSVKSSLDTYETFDSSLYNTVFGYHDDAYNYGEIVGEEQTTCYFFYEERHEEDNNAPPDDEDNNALPDDEDTSFPSGSSLEQNAACNNPAANENEVSQFVDKEPPSDCSLEQNTTSIIPAANEIEVSQFVDQEPPSGSSLEQNTTPNIPAANEIEVSQFVDQEPQSSNEIDVREEDTNENITEPLSPLEIKAIKREINRAYEHFKSNLFNDVDSGYKDMREFLKNIKWRYDHFKRNIAIRKQEEKLNRTYDMETYYFHDDLTTLRPRFRYQDDIEFYVLDQLLRSINVPDLKKWMENNYKKKKVKVYKKECKGHQIVEEILQKLQWEPTTLCRIPEDEPLKITEFDFMQNFVKDLNNISRQKYMKKKKKKKKKEEKNVDVIEKDRESPINVEDPNTSSTSLESIDLSTPEKSEMSSSKEKLDFEAEITVEDPNIFSASLESTDLQTPEKSEILLSEEKLEFKSPVTKEDPGTSSVSLESTDSSTPEKSEISSKTEEQDSENPIIVEDTLPSSASHECVELLISEKIEKTPSKEQLESNNTVADLHPSVEDTCRLEDTPKVSLNEEHECIPEKIVEDSNLEMPSGNKKKENGRLSILDVTEPTLEAAAQKDHPEKRFSSIRKFLSRCCCTKTPPS